MRDVLQGGSYGILPPGDSYDDALPITFLRATEMMPNLKVDLASCYRVAREYFNPKARAKVGDVLLAVKGATIASGKSVAIIEDDPGEAVINGSIFRMSFKDSILPKFAAVVLDSQLLKQQMRLGLVANNGVDYLDKPLIHSLIFPAAKKETQRQIVAIYDEAAKRFHAATDEAAKLLAGIDEYLLSELGITLPPEPENTIANRVFMAQRGDLAGWRFDPYYFGGKFHLLDEALRKARFIPTSLSSLYLSINNGIDCRDFVEDGIPYAKVADVKPFKIDLGTAQKVPAASVPDRGLVKRGDLLLTRKGTFGVAAVVDTDSRFAVSSEVFRIHTDTSKALADFLAILLNSSVCQAQFDRQKIGAIMGSLTQASLRRITLPLPPIQKQKEICDSVAVVQSQALLLRLQAQNEFDVAKRQIEALLLGEVTV